MEIFVIGNGFDLAHGLLTSYSDFLTCCNVYISYTETDGNIEELYPVQSRDERIVNELKRLIKESETDSVIRDHLDEFLSLIRNNCWIKHFNDVSISGGWVDFETLVPCTFKEVLRMLQDCYGESILYTLDKSWIIKVFEGLPNFLRVCREGQALF